MARKTNVARYNPAAFHQNAIPEWGQAMRALNERQRAFVTAKFELGDHPDNTECAIAAGYEDNGNGAIKVQAHRLAHSDAIQAAIREEAERRMISMLPLAARRLEQMVVDPNAKDHFAAVKHAQALGGQSPKQHMVVEHVENRGALIQEIKGSLDILRSLGIKVDGALLPEAIDTEFEEIEDIDGSSEGLEDLL